MIQGRKSSHSTKVVKLAARVGSEFHSSTSRWRVLPVVRAKGKCGYFTRSVKLLFVLASHVRVEVNRTLLTLFIITSTVFTRMRWVSLSKLNFPYSPYIMYVFFFILNFNLSFFFNSSKCTKNGTIQKKTQNV